MQVSIVTINYNNAAGLRQTLESVAHQTYPTIEHVVYDGESADESISIIRKFGLHVSNWQSRPNGGIYYNQNRGLEMTTGEYVLFLNSGDYLYSETAISDFIAQCSPGFDIYYGDLWLLQDGNLSLKQYPDPLPEKYFLYETLPHPASLIRTSLLKTMDGYDEVLKICSDWKFFMHAYFSNARFFHVPVAPSVFGLDGVSSQDKSRGVILQEKLAVLQQDYPNLVEAFKKHHHIADSNPSAELGRRLRSKLRSWLKHS